MLFARAQPIMLTVAFLVAVVTALAAAAPAAHSSAMSLHSIIAVGLDGDLDYDGIADKESTAPLAKK